MTWLPIALALAATPAPAPACHTQQPAPPFDARQASLAGYKPLDDQALAQRLVGRTLRDLSREPPVIYDLNYLEIFHPDGTWESYGGRGGDGGRYEIRDGLLCVLRSRDQHPDCRAIWRNARGQYLMTRAGPMAATTFRITIETSAPYAPPGSGKPICD